MYLLKSINNPRHRRELFDRLKLVDPDRSPRWGRLTAPRMVAHLCDQMRMVLHSESSAPIPSPGHYPLLRELILYVLPWPKGKIQGPPEAFESAPVGWSADLATLSRLVDTFLRTDSDGHWPDHPHFGRMNQKSWAAFCYRHFDHHLRQFGA